jgi:hypothetical protein
MSKESSEEISKDIASYNIQVVKQNYIRSHKGPKKEKHFGEEAKEEAVELFMN